MIFASEEFAFTAVLEDHWEGILREYNAVRDCLLQWPEKKLCDSGWDVFGLYDFPDGRRLVENCDRCPLTASLIQENLPGHGAAGFSVLSAETKIRPHCGYDGDFLRCHLGLVIPAGDVGLRVGDTTTMWRNGKTVVFDDRVEHEAWNLSATSERVVLLVDFPEPENFRHACHD